MKTLTMAALALLLTALAAGAAAQEFDLGQEGPRPTMEMNDRVPYITGGTNPAYRPPPDNSPCTLCKVIQLLAVEAEAFTEITARTIYPLFDDLFKIVLMGWIVVVAIRVMTGSMPDATTAVGRAILAVVIFAALNWLSVWWEYLYLPIRDVTLGLSMAIVGGISHVDIPPNARAWSPFAQIFGMVENAIMSVVMLGWFEIVRPPTGGLAGLTELPAFLVRLLFGLALLLPYAFVMLLFAAYVVEAIFKFLAVTALSPIWLVSAFLPRTRAFTEAAIRLYLSGGLTVVFAAIAMGLTLAVTHTFTGQFVELAKKADDPFYLTWGYWGMLLLGFISLLLHLKAATLASNISGANDGAGPAAGTIAGAKIAAGVAVAQTLRLSGGRGLAGGIAGLGRGYGVPGGIAPVSGAATRYASPRIAALARGFARGRGEDV